MAPGSTSTRGPAARGLAPWTARATVDRPLPGSPRSRTGAPVAAALSIPRRLSARAGKSCNSRGRERGPPEVTELTGVTGSRAELGRHVGRITPEALQGVVPPRLVLKDVHHEVAVVDQH